MTGNRKRAGSALITVIMITAVLTSLLMLSLNRAAIGIHQVRDRYLDGIARSLAENGVEYERYMIETSGPAPAERPHRMDLGDYSGRAGAFEVYARPLEGGGYEVISAGRLARRSGGHAAEVRVRAELRPGPDGRLDIVRWTE